MSEWKIGYPDGLAGVANEDAGKALYDGWSIVPLTISTKLPQHHVYSANSVADNNLTGVGASHTAQDVVGGLVRVNSGVGNGFMYAIESNTATAFYSTGITPYRPSSDGGVLAGDVFEVVTGEAGFAFSRNPKRHDFKMVLEHKSKRMPYATKGFQFPLGRKMDHFSIEATFINRDELNDLMVLLNNPVGYDGVHTLLSHNLTAPLILEQGTHDADHQYLVNYQGFEVVRQASQGKGITLSLQFETVNTPSFRGI